jgi:hypothetical protein
VKTNYCLIENDNVIVDYKWYPFKKDFMPVMVDFHDNMDRENYVAYESGNRSIILHHNDTWFKAKGIGIPKGISKPIYKNSQFYTYILNNDLEMCHKSVIWGFMEKNDADSEIFGTKYIGDIQNNIISVGYGILENINYITYKDRKELFYNLKKSKESVLKKLFNYSSKKDAYCFFMKVFSDIRVQEILFPFMFPQIAEILDEDDCKEYIGWLGNSCGRILKILHDNDILHGTWLGNRNMGSFLDIHSNSYIGNYILDESKIGIVDFDLTEKNNNSNIKEMEKKCLIQMENPLFYAGSFIGNEALEMGLVKKNEFRENLAKIFEAGVDEGYSGNEYYIEMTKRAEMLKDIVDLKDIIWNLYEIPKDLVGNVYYLEYLIKNKEANTSDIRELFE